MKKNDKVVEPELHIEGLTQKELEALGTAKSLNILDKQTHFAQEVARDKKKEKRAKNARLGLIITGVVLFILLLIVQVFIYIKNQTPVDPTPNVVLEYADTLPVGEYIPPSIDLSGGASDSEIYTIISGYQLETGDSEFELRFENDRENTQPLKLTLYLMEKRKFKVSNNEQTGNTENYVYRDTPTYIIYESKLVPPDREIVSAKLDKVLPAGNYTVMALMEFINPETGKVSKYQEFADIPLVILK